MDCAMAFDSAIINTWFEKKIDQFASYKSEDRKTQIDFLMYRRSQLREIRNCKVINRESVAAQHRLVVLDWEMKGVKKHSPTQVPRKIGGD